MIRSFVRRRGAPTVQPQRGFTLIELLVVVAIIALLISILLPSLGDAREQGKRTKCGVNLRSVGQAAALCQNDNREFLPSWDDGVAQGAPAANRSHYLYTFTDTLFDLGYMGNRDAAICPTDRQPDLPLDWRTSPGQPYARYGWVNQPGINEQRKGGWRGSYGLSSIMHGNFREDRFQDAARQVYSADAWWCWFSSVGAANVMSVRILGSVPSPIWPNEGNTLAWRHGRNLLAQFLYRDGHVAPVQPKIPRSQLELLHNTVDTVASFTWLPGESASRDRLHSYAGTGAPNPERMRPPEGGSLLDNRKPKWVQVIEAGGNGGVNHTRVRDAFNWQAPSFPEHLNATWRSENRAWRNLPNEFPRRM